MRCESIRTYQRCGKVDSRTSGLWKEHGVRRRRGWNERMGRTICRRPIPLSRFHREWTEIRGAERSKDSVGALNRLHQRSRMGWGKIRSVRDDAKTHGVVELMVRRLNEHSSHRQHRRHIVAALVGSCAP